MASHIEVLPTLPLFMRQDIFKSGVVLPPAFLQSIAASLPPGMEEQDEETQQAFLDVCKYAFEDLQRFAGDFFGYDSQNRARVPDAVYEVFGHMCHMGDDDPAMAEAPFSEKAKTVWQEIEWLKIDPYPRQADYASNEARFLFLLASYFKSRQFVDDYIMHGVPGGDMAYFRQNFMEPLRTLRKGQSLLEDSLLSQLQYQEFLLACEDHPRYREPLAFIRTHCRETLKTAEMLKKLGLPHSKKSAAGLNIAYLDLDKYGDTRAEKLMTMIGDYCAPIPVLLAFRPDIDEEYVTFALNYPHICNEAWETVKENTYGEDAEKYELWFIWLQTADKDPENTVPQEVKNNLADVMAAVEITKIENIDLLFRQHGTEPVPIGYRQSLLDAKADLLQMRNYARLLPAHNQDLQTCRDEMLRSSLARLHELSYHYPELAYPIDIEKAEPIYDDMAPH